MENSRADYVVVYNFEGERSSIDNESIPIPMQTLQDPLLRIAVVASRRNGFNNFIDNKTQKSTLLLLDRISIQYSYNILVLLHRIYFVYITKLQMSLHIVLKCAKKYTECI